MKRVTPAPLSDEARERLHEMFAADRDAPDFYRRFPPYRGDHALGAPPWWPPLSQVWQRQGKIVDYDAERPSMQRGWREAWALLQRLHGEYVRP